MNNPENTEILIEKKKWVRKSRAKPKNVPVIKEESLDNINMDMEETVDIGVDNYDVDFLAELNNNQDDDIQDEYEESIPEIKKPRKSRAKKNVEVYVEPERTPIYGKTKLVLIRRLQEYKRLFPQLATFHYSNDQDEDELQAVLNEFQSIIQINNQDDFIEETIFQSIRMCEGFSTKTKYDISGLSIILKHNKGFTDILKILHLKYSSYLNIPPEAQACLIISCSIAIVLQKNQNKSSRDSYLNEPIN